MKKKVTFLSVMLLTVVIFSFVLLAGCGSKTPKPSAKVKEYYKLLSAKKFEKAYKLILPENPPAITREEYVQKLKDLEKNFMLKEVKVVSEEVKGDQAEVTIEVTEVDKGKGVVVTSQAKVSLKMKDSKWYLVWPKKEKKEGKKN